MRKKGALFVVVLLVLGLFGSVVGCVLPAPIASSTPSPETISAPTPITWTQLSLHGQIECLAIDPTNSQVLYAGNTNGDHSDTLKTTNGGSSSLVIMNVCAERV